MWLKVLRCYYVIIRTHLVHLFGMFCLCVQLQGTVMEYVRTLMRVMPKSCKLLRYDYGSPGWKFYHLEMRTI